MLKTKSQFDVITYGEAMAMFIAQEQEHLAKVDFFRKQTAGAELNVAIGLARLGFNVAWLSRLGNDSFGKFILDELKKEKVSTDFVVTTSEQSTGFVLKSKEINGADPTVEYHRKNSAASYLSTNNIDPEHILNTKHLHATGISAALSDSCKEFSFYVIDLMRQHKKTVSFDPNLRPSLWKNRNVMVSTINELAFKSNWVFPGIKEGTTLTGFTQPESIADFYLDKGVDLVVIKLGSKGAYFKNRNNDTGIVPAYPIIQVIDTVGAGDGFAVGVISALLENKSLYEATKRGNKIGSLAVQVIGDNEGYPNRIQLGDF